MVGAAQPVAGAKRLARWVLRRSNPTYLAITAAVGAGVAGLATPWTRIDGSDLPFWCGGVGTVVVLFSAILGAFSTDSRKVENLKQRVAALETTLKIAKADASAQASDALLRGTYESVHHLATHLSELTDVANGGWTSKESARHAKSIPGLGARLLEGSGVPNPRVCFYTVRPSSNSDEALPLLATEGRAASAIDTLERGQCVPSSLRDPSKPVLKRADAPELFDALLHETPTVIRRPAGRKSHHDRPWQVSVVMPVSEWDRASQTHVVSGAFTIDSTSSDAFDERADRSLKIVARLLAEVFSLVQASERRPNSGSMPEQKRVMRDRAMLVDFLEGEGDLAVLGGGPSDPVQD